MEPPVLELSNKPAEYMEVPENQPPLLKHHESAIDTIRHDITDVKDEHPNKNRVSDKKPFLCSHKDCTKSFVSRSSLKRHMTDSHSPSPVVWRCCFCNKISANQGVLKQHIKRYHLTLSMKEQSIPCKGCGHDRALNQHKQLEGNIKQHPSGSSHYRCEMRCYKLFINQRTLRKHHLNVHKVKVRECVRDGGLKNHKKPMDVSEEPKPELQYRCTQPGCNRAFSLQNKLKAHTIKHQEYECEVCLKTFMFKSRLKKHLYSHTTNHSVYICGHEDCKQKYKYLESLKFHLNAIHFNKQLFSGHDKSRLKHTPKKIARKQTFHTKTMAKVNPETKSKGQNSVADLKSQKQELSKMDKQHTVNEKSNIQPEEPLRTFSKCPNATETTIFKESQVVEESHPETIDTEESENFNRPSDNEYRETD